MKYFAKEFCEQNVFLDTEGPDVCAQGRESPSGCAPEGNALRSISTRPDVFFCQVRIHTKGTEENPRANKQPPEKGRKKEGREREAKKEAGEGGRFAALSRP